MKENKKTATDLSTKHFSRYGEFLVSFELSVLSYLGVYTFATNLSF